MFLFEKRFECKAKLPVPSVSCTFFQGIVRFRSRFRSSSDQGVISGPVPLSLQPDADRGNRLSSEPNLRTAAAPGTDAVAAQGRKRSRSSSTRVELH